MELDEFKTVLRKREAAGPFRSPEALEDMLRHKSRSSISKIQQNLWLEMTFCLIFIISISYLMVVKESAYLRLFGSLMLLYSAGFLYYLLTLHRNIEHASSRTSTVRQTIRQVIRTVSRFQRIYFQLTLIFVPATFLLVFASADLDRVDTWQEFTRLMAGHVRWLFVVVASVTYLALFGATKWYVKKLYGSHLQDLKQKLRDLENG